MLKIEITSGNNVLENYLAKLENNFPLSKISQTVQNDIKAEAERRGWHRIPNTIKRRVIDKNTHEIYLGGKEKDKDVAVYLNDGTTDHFIKPKKKKALHWEQGGEGFFSKGHFAKGIKATHFFRIYESTLQKLTAITINFIKTGN